MAFHQNLTVWFLILACCFSARGAVVNFQILKGFDVPAMTAEDGKNPNIPGIGAGDGMLYGPALSGGSHNQGTIYRMSTRGQSFEVIWHFGDVPSDGSGPLNVQDGRDGWLYGTAYFGGISNVGCIFRLHKDGSDYAILHGFRDGLLDGGKPLDITLASDGLIYGVAEQGGTNNAGLIYRLARDGSQFSVLSHLGGTNGLPGSGCTKLLEATDGLLYGYAYMGGSEGRGAVYKIGKNGSNLQVLRNTAISEGIHFGMGGPVQGPDGFLYGLADGIDGDGASGVFKMDTNGLNFSYLHTFIGPGYNGAIAWYELAIAPDGYLYFPMIQGLLTDKLGRIRLDGTDFSIVQEFDLYELYPQIQISPEGQLFGAATGVFALSFSNAPAVLISPKSRSAVPGELVQLSAGLSLTGPHQFQWFRDDVPIPNGTNLNLKLGPVGYTNAGRYSLTVSNSLGSATSSPAALWLMSMSSPGGLALYSPTGQVFQIQGATNLAAPMDWMTLTTLTTTTNPSWFIDSESSNASTRFYRSVLLP